MSRPVRRASGASDHCASRVSNSSTRSSAMTYRDAIHISTDSHVTEPIEIYGERVDAAFRGRVPRIETVGDWRTLLIEGLGPRKLMPASEREVAIVGDFDAEDRFRDQLQIGRASCRENG